MIVRDLAADLAHAEPADALPRLRLALAGSSLVWHALALPIEHTGGVEKIVLTGHIVCHDCLFCETAGDIRFGGKVVPWQERVSDCCDSDEERMALKSSS